jgi:hypothetical protein
VGCTSVTGARVVDTGRTTTASGRAIGLSGAVVFEADTVAGPLVTAVTPQQLRAEGNDAGWGQWPQQLIARSSAATTAGFV